MCPSAVNPFVIDEQMYNVIVYCVQVINAYIYYLRGQVHLQIRAGGQVWLDTTHTSTILRRDGEIPISPEEFHNIVRRALNYLRHDMVRPRT